VCIHFGKFCAEQRHPRQVVHLQQDDYQATCGTIAANRTLPGDHVVLQALNFLIALM
jgi:hypothetical protein